MKAGTPRVENAHTIERANSKFVFPLDRLTSGSNRDSEGPVRRRSLIRTNIGKDLLGCSDTCRALQDADKARFTRTVLSENNRHAGSEIDLRAGLQCIYAVANG